MLMNLIGSMRTALPMIDPDPEQTAMLVEPLRSLTGTITTCLQRWMVLDEAVRTQCFLVLHGGPDGERRTLNGQQITALYAAALEQATLAN